MWHWENAKYKDHVPHKIQKAAKIEESYICIECSEVSLNSNLMKSIHFCVGKITPA